MAKHTCKQCGRIYNYCKECMFKPIPYKAAGFCSKECSAAFKAPKVEIPEIVEATVVGPIVIEEAIAETLVVEEAPKPRKRSRAKIELEDIVVREIDIAE